MPQGDSQHCNMSGSVAYIPFAQLVFLLHYYRTAWMAQPFHMCCTGTRTTMNAWTPGAWTGSRLPAAKGAIAAAPIVVTQALLCIAGCNDHSTTVTSCMVNIHMHQSWPHTQMHTPPAVILRCASHVHVKMGCMFTTRLRHWVPQIQQWISGQHGKTTASLGSCGQLVGCDCTTQSMAKCRYTHYMNQLALDMHQLVQHNSNLAALASMIISEHRVSYAAHHFEHISALQATCTSPRARASTLHISVWQRAVAVDTSSGERLPLNR